jgi:hypothetical protein
MKLSVSAPGFHRVDLFTLFGAAVGVWGGSGPAEYSLISLGANKGGIYVLKAHAGNASITRIIAVR